MIILGIDPGVAIIGYGALECDDSNKVTIVSHGSIQTDKKQTLQVRLLEIHDDFKVLLETLKPDVIVIEELFFFKNAKTIIPVLEARGVLLMTAEMYGIKVYEYTPLVVKQVITGYGRAEKSEIKQMLLQLLNLKKLPKLDDIVDAIAIAYCHIRQMNLS